MELNASSNLRLSQMDLPNTSAYVEGMILDRGERVCHLWINNGLIDGNPEREFGKGLIKFYNWSSIEMEAVDAPGCLGLFGVQKKIQLPWTLSQDFNEIPVGQASGLFNNAKIHTDKIEFSIIFDRPFSGRIDFTCSNVEWEAEFRRL